MPESIDQQPHIENQPNPLANPELKKAVDAELNRPAETPVATEKESAKSDIKIDPAILEAAKAQAAQSANYDSKLANLDNLDESQKRLLNDILNHQHLDRDASELTDMLMGGSADRKN